MTRWLQHYSLHFQSQERVLASEWPAWQQHYSLHLPRECLRQNEQPDNSTIHYTSQESACVRMNSLTTALFTTPPKRVLASEQTAWQQHYSLHLPRECLHQNKQPDNSTIHYTSQESACIRTNSLTTALFTTPPKRVLVSEWTAWQQHYSLHLPSQERVLASERTAWQQHYSLHLPSQERVLASEQPGDYSTVHYTSDHKRECLRQNEQPDNSTIHYTSNHKWECLHQNDQVTTAH